MLLKIISPNTKLGSTNLGFFTSFWKAGISTLFNVICSKNMSNSGGCKFRDNSALYKLLGQNYLIFYLLSWKWITNRSLENKGISFWHGADSLKISFEMKHLFSSFHGHRSQQHCQESLSKVGTPIEMWPY